MTDHQINVRFQVNGGMTAQKRQEAAQDREDRIVAHMAAAISGGSGSALTAIKAESEARTIYRAVMAMHEALAKEIG